MADFIRATGSTTPASSSTTGSTSTSDPISLSSSTLLRILKHVPLPSTLLFPSPIGLQYNINRGTSSFRSLLQQLLDDDKEDTTSSSDNDDIDIILKLVLTNEFKLSNAVRSIILVCCGYGDVAHEVVLGVDYNNLDEAEYAATHPGRTNFASKYPLSTVDRMVHSIIHRYCEGHTYGEGNYTGYDNAKYWIAGGPQKWYEHPSSNTTQQQQQHPVYTKLCNYARSYTPLCVSLGIVIENNTVEHTIIAGGGKYRTVIVGNRPSSCTDPKLFWDPFCFIDLIATTTEASITDTITWSKGNTNKQVYKEELIKELISLQEMELTLLLQHELESLSESIIGI